MKYQVDTIKSRIKTEWQRPAVRRKIKTFSIVFILINLLALPISVLFLSRINDASAAMGVKTKTVEFFIGQEFSTSGISSGTSATYDFSIYLPDAISSPGVIRSAFIEYNTVISAVNASSTTFQLGPVGNLTALSSPGVWYQSGESQPIKLRLDSTAKLQTTIQSSGTFNLRFTTQVTGPIRYGENAKLYLTYDYDADATTQIKTTYAWVHSQAATVASGSTVTSANFNLGLPEASIVSRSTWIETRGYVNTTLTAGYYWNSESQRNISWPNTINSYGFVALVSPSTTYSPNTNNNFKIVSGTGAFSAPSAVLIYTYSFNYSSSSELMNSVSALLFQGTETASTATLTGNRAINIPETGITMKSSFLKGRAVNTNTAAMTSGMNAQLGSTPTTTPINFLANAAETDGFRDIVWDTTGNLSGMTSGNNTVYWAYATSAVTNIRGLSLILTYKYTKSTSSNYNFQAEFFVGQQTATSTTWSQNFTPSISDPIYTLSQSFLSFQKNLNGTAASTYTAGVSSTGAYAFLSTGEAVMGEGWRDTSSNVSELGNELTATLNSSVTGTKSASFLAQWQSGGAEPFLSQSGFHWRNNDGDEASATSRSDGNENTSIIANKNVVLRLRFQVSNIGTYSSSSVLYRIEYAQSSNCSTAGYTPIPVTPTTEHFNMADSIYLSDGGQTTDIDVSIGGITNPSGKSFFTGQTKESSNTTSGITLTSSQFTEIEYSFIANDNALWSTNYCFRLTDNGNNLDDYSQYATLVTASESPNISQYGYRWRNDNGADYDGDQSITLHPTGTGNYNAWTIGAGCTEQWDCLNDQADNSGVGEPTAHDGDTSRLVATTAVRSSFSLDDDTIPNNTTVTKIETVITAGEVAATGTDPTIRSFYRLNNADNDCATTTQHGTTAYTTLSSCTFNVSLSSADLNNLEIGILWGSTDPKVTRFYVNITYNQTSASFKQLENLPHTDQAKDENIRLRFLINNTGGTISQPYRVQYVSKTASCGTINSGWTLIPAVATTEDFVFSTSSYFADQDLTFNIDPGLTDPPGSTFVSGYMTQYPSSYSGGVSLGKNTFSEIEYNFQATNSASGSYCFRLVRGSSNLELENYSEYPELSIISGGISVSGITNISSGTVAIAINSNRLIDTGSVLSGSFLVETTVSPSDGDVITVWVDGADVDTESTAVTKYISGDVSGMILNKNYLSVGSNQNTSITVSELGYYDFDSGSDGGDEDVVHTANSGVLNAGGGGGYVDPGINILSDNGLVIDGAETLAAHNINIIGTLTSSGASTYHISGKWNNQGNFIASSSEATFNGSILQSIKSGGNSFYSVNIDNNGLGNLLDIKDTFSRTQASGWGASDSGINWNISSGTVTDFSVDGSSAKTSNSSVNSQRLILLDGTSVRDSEVAVDLNFEAVPTGAGVLAVPVTRYIDANYLYGARVTVSAPNGSMSLIGHKRVAGSNLTFGTSYDTGLNMNPSKNYRVKTETLGISPTIMRIKLWEIGQPEPDWQFVGSDSTTELQTSGSLGIRTILNTGNTNTLPYDFSFDNYEAYEIGSNKVVLEDALNINSNLSILRGDLDTSVFSRQVDVKGSWYNTGKFTPNRGLVTFSGSSSQVVSSGGNNFYNLILNNTGSSPDDSLIPTDSLSILGDLTLTDGRLRMDMHNTNITTFGNVTFSSLAALSYGSGLWTFSPIGTKTFVSNIPITPVIGRVSISGGSNSPNLTLGSNMVVTKLEVTESHTLNIGNSGYALFLNGDGQSADILSVSGFLSQGFDSRVIFRGQNSGGNVNIYPYTYSNLEIGGPSTNETYDLAGDITTNTVKINSSINTNTFDASSYTINILGNGTPFVISDTEIFVPSSSTINYSPLDTTGVNITSTTYHHVNFNKSSNVFSLQSGGVATNNGGGMAVIAGTLDVTTNNYPIAIGGNWNNNGSFIAREGTVTFNDIGGSVQVIGGTSNTTFYNLYSTAASARTINFASGSTTTVLGTWTVTGASGQHISLGRDGGSGADQWYINPTNWNIDYVTPSNSNNQAVNPINPVNYVDGGNNTNWFYSANQPPNLPSSLTQKTSPSNVDIAEGAWTNDSTPTLGFTITDPDGDTVKYRIQIDGTSSSFSNLVLDYTYGSLSSSGTTFSYTIGQSGGIYAVGFQDMTLSDSTTGYWWRVKAIDEYSDESAYSLFGNNSNVDFRVDATAPTGGTVNDGQISGGDLDWNSNGSLTEYLANWTASQPSSAVSGLLRYEYGLRRATDDFYWTPGSPGSWGADDYWYDNGTNTSFTVSGLNLETSVLYYVSLKTFDNAGNSSTINSNGLRVTPTLSYSISSNVVNFDDLNNANNWTDSKTTTVTTSTNASGGYTIKAYASDYLRSITYVAQYIIDFIGTWVSPQAWNGFCKDNSSFCGFGYTSSDTSVQGSNRFNEATLFSKYIQASPGDVVADNTGPVNGSTGAIDNESFTVTHKVSVDPSQAASAYQALLYFIVTANY